MDELRVDVRPKTRVAKLNQFRAVGPAIAKVQRLDLRIFDDPILGKHVQVIGVGLRGGQNHLMWIDADDLGRFCRKVAKALAKKRARCTQ